jgi:hypothetical protein
MRQRSDVQGYTGTAPKIYKELLGKVKQLYKAGDARLNPDVWNTGLLVMPYMKDGW